MVATKNVLNATLKHAQRRKSKDIKLDEAHGLKVSNILALAPWSLSDATGIDERHVLIQVLCNHNAAGMSRAWAHLSIKSLNVCLDMRILSQECLKRSAEFHYLFEGRIVNAGFDAMLLLCWRLRLMQHVTGNRINLCKRNSIKLWNILDERAQLQRVPVWDWSNSIFSPLVNQHFLQQHRICNIIIDVWIVCSVWA